MYIFPSLTQAPKCVMAQKYRTIWRVISTAPKIPKCEQPGEKRSPALMSVDHSIPSRNCFCKSKISRRQWCSERSLCSSKHSYKLNVHLKRQLNAVKSIPLLPCVQCSWRCFQSSFPCFISKSMSRMDRSTCVHQSPTVIQSFPRNPGFWVQAWDLYRDPWAPICLPILFQAYSSWLSTARRKLQTWFSINWKLVSNEQEMRLTKSSSYHWPNFDKRSLPWRYSSHRSLLLIHSCK